MNVADVVVAAGLSPAWQQTLVFESFSLGEVNRAVEVHRCASGKVVNVALSAAHAGGAARLVTIVGGDFGRRIVEDCQGQGIDARFIATRSPSRQCTTIVDRATGQVTELVENMSPIEPAELAAFREAYREAVRGASAIVLSGSLPPGAPEETIRQLAAEADAPVVLDVRGPELLAALSAAPWVVKPNRRELEATLGRKLTDEREVFEAAEELRRLGARQVVVTAGGGPLLAIDAAGRQLRVPPLPITVRNPIGSGDALAAGLALGASRGLSLAEALPPAIALAAANAESLLPGRF